MSYDRVTYRTTFTKQCKCHPATASGPRIVSSCLELGDDRHLTVTMKLVRMACDRCDVEWSETDEATT